jgi:predicted O-linked N-acetylglucosamine transferase (SPINDLY family)
MIPRAELHVPETFNYCVFVNNFRWTPFEFNSWMQILRRTNGTSLVLKLFGPEMQANVQEWMSWNYPDLSPDRLQWLPGTGNDHIAWKASACNVALDVHHYNGHSNNADALWAGLPLVPYPAQDFAGRAGAAFCEAQGLGELIAATAEEYVDIAVRLASDPAFYRRIRDQSERARLEVPAS